MSDHNEPPKRETLNEKQFPGTKVSLKFLKIELSPDVQKHQNEYQKSAIIKKCEKRNR